MFLDNIKPCNLESSNRRSWESPKLSNRIEEEDTTGFQDNLDIDDNSFKSNKSPVSSRESVFSKFKHFRKGRYKKKSNFFY